MIQSMDQLGTSYWLDSVGLFLLLSGLIIGLGAVTVIEILAWCGRRSPYWTLATTRTHRVTKPLIWVGVFLSLFGAIIAYRNYDFTGLVALQAFIAAAVILNGLWLTFHVSPHLLRREDEGRERTLLSDAWQRKIYVSFLISFFGWWAIVFLLAMHLTAAPALPSGG